MRRAALLAALLATLLAPAAAPAATVRASLTDIEDEVMCTTCKIPLNVAESPQADRERSLIRDLVAQGLTKEQIKKRLVGEFGDDVLALPKRSGFGLTAYAVPLGLVALLAGGLSLLLPRWRRRTVAAGIAADAPDLSAGDAQRLDEELERYAG